ncbi:MAG: hypothetical protein RL411_1667 [Bacteroidota bacterium]
MFKEQFNSSSALISLKGVPATDRVKTFTPLPDFDTFQGTSGLVIQGNRVSIMEIDKSFMHCENKAKHFGCIFIFDESYNK